MNSQPFFSKVKRAFHERLIFDNVRVNLRRPRVLVSEKFLNGANIVVFFRVSESQNYVERYDNFRICVLPIFALLV